MKEGVMIYQCSSKNTYKKLFQFQIISNLFQDVCPSITQRDYMNRNVLNEIPSNSIKRYEKI